PAILRSTPPREPLRSLSGASAESSTLAHPGGSGFHAYHRISEIRYDAEPAAPAPESAHLNQKPVEPLCVPRHTHHAGHQGAVPGAYLYHRRRLPPCPSVASQYVRPLAARYPPTDRRHRSLGVQAHQHAPQVLSRHTYH